MREFPVKDPAQFIYILFADDSLIGRGNGFDERAERCTVRIQRRRNQNISVDHYAHGGLPFRADFFDEFVDFVV